MWITNLFKPSSVDFLKSSDYPSLFNIDYFCNKSKDIYFSKDREVEINDNFNKHDGYFSKLVIGQKVIGYIFRCVHKDVKLVNKNQEEKIIPFFVTCVYQPAISNIKNSISKTLGKECALKTGIRSIKQYIKDTDDFELTVFKENLMDVSKVFPEYSAMKKDSNFEPEFWNMTEEEYKNTVDYIKSFDEKTFKYYSDIKKENIVKIWIKN